MEGWQEGGMKEGERVSRKELSVGLRMVEPRGWRERREEVGVAARSYRQEVNMHGN